MSFTNVSTITEFILTGFPGLERNYYGAISVLVLVIYLAIIAGNSLIIIIVAMQRCLQKPPYFIFCKLALSDMVIATAVLPKVIVRYWAEDNVISFSACFLQMFIVHLLHSYICLLMMIMALDRFIAICNPLRYQALMKNSTTLALCGLSWFISMVQMVTVLALSLSLPYCNSKTILHCYCNTAGIITLACGNVKELQSASFVGGLILLLGPLTFIIFSYTSIIVSVMKITIVGGRYKMFSTCSPQLFIICLYFIPRCFNLLASKLNFNFSADMRILITMLYCFVPPIVNPFIYCLRTTEVKEALVRKLKAIKGSVSTYNI